MEKLGETLLRVIPGTWPEGSGNSYKAKKCDVCAEEIKPIRLPLVDEVKMVYPRCSCEVAKYHEEKKARAKQEQQTKLESLLGPRFAGCTLENFKVLPGTKTAYQATENFIRNISANIQAGKGLLLFGPPGNGKSHLAATIVRSALATGYTAFFERVPRLLIKIKATYSENSGITEADILERMVQAGVIVLDDAGAEKWTQWTEPTLYTIVDERYSHKKALVITTNSSLEQLENKIGTRAMDRILEMCDIVENRGASYRQMKAAARQKPEATD